MTRTLVIGARGRTGALVVRALLAAGDEVVGTVRQPEHVRELVTAGARGEVLDLMTAVDGDFDRVMTGVDAVVYTAGSGAGSSRETVSRIDGRAIVDAADSAVRAQVGRFVLVSAHRADEDYGDSYVDHLLRTKRAADAHLRRTPLDWTIIRPDALTSGAPTGRVQAATQVPHGALSRADLARVVQVALTSPSTRRRQFEVIGGSDPVQAALDAL